MSLHYLLDGYNVLKKIPAFRDQPLEDGRHGFLKWISEARPQGSVHNQLTVVFDGHPDYFGGSGSQGDIRVIFSDGCCADDKIKRMVDEDADVKNCVVVSDDKDVFLYARSMGARIMTVAAFTSKAMQGGAGAFAGRSSKGTSAKYIPLSRQEKINQEMSDIWLKDK